MGGLGNQLFQIFAGIAYAIKYKYAFRIRMNKYDESAVRPTYWNTFFRSIKGFTIPDALIYKYAISVKYQETPNFRHADIPSPEKIVENMKNNFLLFGYFQSYKYFQKEYNEICKFLKLDTLKNEVYRKCYDDYLKDKNTVEETQTQTQPTTQTDPQKDNNTIIVSMHFRLGDYKKLGDHHPILDYNYYYKSLVHIINDTIIPQTQPQPMKIICFYENEDIEYVRNIIYKLNTEINAYIKQKERDQQRDQQRDQPYPQEIEFVFMNNDKYADWEQVIIMSLCDHCIIANSSFSWWGAYINDKYQEWLNNKTPTSSQKPIIIYPSIWFTGKSKGNDTSDLCPDDWVCI